jgi:hypothetical protein
MEPQRGERKGMRHREGLGGHGMDTSCSSDTRSSERGLVEEWHDVTLFPQDGSGCCCVEHRR